MYITKENIKEFIGKTVDCHHRMHHYYPLTIRERDGELFYVDTTGTWIRYGGEAIYYDVIVQLDAERTSPCK